MNVWPPWAVQVTFNEEHPLASQHWTPGEVGVAVPIVELPLVNVIVDNEHWAQGLRLVEEAAIVVVEAGFGEPVVFSFSVYSFFR
jgi:hypothetical protein